MRACALSIRGPERATLLERFFSVLHVPYSLGCLLLAFVVGPPFAALLTYVQTSSMDDALTRTLYLFLGEARAIMCPSARSMLMNRTVYI
jgi:hypothetical protein